MTSPAAFVWSTGELVVAGHAPDGDPVRFVPTDVGTVRVTGRDAIFVAVLRQEGDTIALTVDVLDLLFLG